MSKTKKEEVVEKTTDEIKEVKTTSEDVQSEGGDMKMKKKVKPTFKKNTGENNVTKVDLSKPPKSEQQKVEEQVEQTKQEDDAIPVGETKEMDVEEQTGDSTKVDEQVQEPSEDAKTEENPIQEIKEEEPKEKVETQDGRTPVTSKENNDVVYMPDSVKKLVDFMDDTGGSIDDYVRLNADYSKIDNNTLLKEYYKKTRPHLDNEEISFLMEDNFSYDEEVDEERAVKKKKLARKEEIAKAKNFLNGLKDKYYEEIKLRPTVSNEQRKAMDFFNDYNKREEVAKQQHEDFVSTTKKMFSDEFKGFDFNVGEKKFRYGIKDAHKVGESQSNINTFIRKFLNEKGEVNDYAGYHKAIYAAQNVDTIAQHFYDQGKADATKNIMKQSKNIDEKPRQAPEDVYVGGWKVRAVTDGTDLSKLRIKKPKFNKNN